MTYTATLPNFSHISHDDGLKAVFVRNGDNARDAYGEDVAKVGLCRGGTPYYSDENGREFAYDGKDAEFSAELGHQISKALNLVDSGKDRNGLALAFLTHCADKAFEVFDTMDDAEKE